MKQTITESMFIDAFNQCGRGDNFSYEGLKAIFEWVEELDESCETDTELDPIGICCELSEYESALDCIETAGYDCPLDDDLDEDEKEGEALVYLQEHTPVIIFGRGIIIQDF